MTPALFLAEVAQPNMQAALEQPDCLRMIVNAILTLDTLAGITHAQAAVNGRPEIAAHRTDDKYRDELAVVSPSFRVLRDAAASLKHGELTGTKARLVRASDALRTVPNALGLFQFGDRLGSNVVVIEVSPAPGYVRATNAIADSYRMLARIVAGEAARTDEHDRGTFMLAGTP